MECNCSPVAVICIRERMLQKLVNWDGSATVFALVLPSSRSPHDRMTCHCISHSFTQLNWVRDVRYFACMTCWWCATRPGSGCWSGWRPKTVIATTSIWQPDCIRSEDHPYGVAAKIRGCCTHGLRPVLVRDQRSLTSETSFPRSVNFVYLCRLLRNLSCEYLALTGLRPRKPTVSSL